jgi:hypothetical protein
MTEEQKTDWVTLSEAFNRLCRVNEFFRSSGVEAIAKAIQSGHVLLRGVQQLMREPEQLPGKIDGREIRAPDFTCILENRLYLKNNRFVDFAHSFAPADFEQVTIDWRGLNEFGRELWPDMWPVEAPPPPPLASTAKAKTPAAKAREQGRPSHKRKRVEAEMRADLESGYTIGSLNALLGKQLVERYGPCSRYTAEKARKTVLSETARRVGNSIPDN